MAAVPADPELTEGQELYKMVKSLVASQQEVQQEVKNLALGQKEIAGAVGKAQDAIAVLQSGQNLMHERMSQADACVAAMSARQQQVDAEFAELRKLFEGKTRITAAADAEMPAASDEAASAAEKKRKLAQQGAGVSASQSSWADAAAKANAQGQQAGRGGQPRAGSAGVPRARQASAPQDDESLRTKVVMKRLPPVMKERLPALCPQLFDFIGQDLVRIQGPGSGTLFKIVLATEAKAAAVLKRHKEQPFTGVFEPQAPEVTLSLQPDREVWLRKLLTLQWPVLDYLHSLPTVENASMTKFRRGERRYVRIYVKEASRDVLREVGIAEYREISEDGPEPDEWLSLSPGEGSSEVFEGVRRAMNLGGEA